MTIKLTILGCAGSAAVPTIGNDWGVCDPNNPKNRRRRASVLVQSGTTAVVIDTGPDFYAQMTERGLRRPDAILYTHFHGDHINGFEELRVMFNADRSLGLLPLYADPLTQSKIREKFPHMFVDYDPTGFYALPVEFKGWSEDDFTATHRIGDIDIRLIKMHHGDIMCTGYRFGDVAYCTDVHAFPEEGFEALRGTHTLIIDCNNFARRWPVELHMTLGDVMVANKRIGASRVILTHLKHDVDYDCASAHLPAGFELAYDGLQIIVK